MKAVVLVNQICDHLDFCVSPVFKSPIFGTIHFVLTRKILRAVKILIKPMKEEKEEMLSSYNGQTNVQRNSSTTLGHSYMPAYSHCETRASSWHLNPFLTAQLKRKPQRKDKLEK